MRAHLALIALLAACGSAQNVRQIPIANLDLSNMKVVTDIQSQLPTAQRPALATYALLHWPGSKAFCGHRLSDKSGHEPSTVGEAIDLTLLREAQNAARPDTLLPEPERNLVHALERLESQRDSLVVQRDVALQMGKPDTYAGQIRVLDGKLAVVRTGLSKFKK